MELFQLIKNHKNHNKLVNVNKLLSLSLYFVILFSLLNCYFVVLSIECI